MIIEIFSMAQLGIEETLNELRYTQFLFLWKMGIYQEKYPWLSLYWTCVIISIFTASFGRGDYQHCFLTMSLCRTRCLRLSKVKEVIYPPVLNTLAAASLCLTDWTKLLEIIRHVTNTAFMKTRWWGVGDEVNMFGDLGLESQESFEIG